MEPTSFSVFKTILAYSIFILASPITTFIVSKKFLFEGILGASDVTANVWSAIFAVIILHIALGLYIRRAYYEAEQVKPEKID